MKHILIIAAIIFPLFTSTGHLSAQQLQTEKLRPYLLCSGIPAPATNKYRSYYFAQLIYNTLRRPLPLYVYRESVHTGPPNSQYAIHYVPFSGLRACDEFRQILSLGIRQTLY